MLWKKRKNELCFSSSVGFFQLKMYLQSPKLSHNGCINDSLKRRISWPISIKQVGKCLAKRITLSWCLFLQGFQDDLRMCMLFFFWTWTQNIQLLTFLHSKGTYAEKYSGNICLAKMRIRWHLETETWKLELRKSLSFPNSSAVKLAARGFHWGECFSKIQRGSEHSHAQQKKSEFTFGGEYSGFK